MKPELLEELIETSITPIANYDLVGNQLNIRIVKPNANDPHIERLQRGVKFTTNVESENIVQNLEYFGIEIDSDLRSRIIRDIKGTGTVQPSFKEVSDVVAKKSTVTDRNGAPFNPDKHAVDERGEPILTKYKLFQKKV